MNTGRQQQQQVLLVLPYPPSVNALRAIFTPKRGRARMIDTTIGRAYKAAIRMILHASGAQFRWTAPLRLEVDLFRPRRAGDSSNPLKALEDGLQTERVLEEALEAGVKSRRRVPREAGLYEDDDQTVEIHVRRFEDKEAPRVQVRVTVVTGPGGPPPERWATPPGWNTALAHLEVAMAKERRRRAKKEQAKAALVGAPARSPRAPHAVPSFIPGRKR